MAEYSRREVTTVQVEYYLPSPVNWAEVGKAFAAVKQELGEEASQWDTAAWFEARDDEIVIRFEKSKEKSC
jgi:hypothetical protein